MNDLDLIHYQFLTLAANTNTIAKRSIAYSWCIICSIEIAFPLNTNNYLDKSSEIDTWENVFNFYNYNNFL